MENLTKLIGGLTAVILSCLRVPTASSHSTVNFTKILKKYLFFFLYIFRARDLDLEFQFRILTSALGKIYIHYI